MLASVLQAASVGMAHGASVFTAPTWTLAVPTWYYKHRRLRMIAPRGGGEVRHQYNSCSRDAYDAVVHVLPDAAKVLGAVAKLS